MNKHTDNDGNHSYNQELTDCIGLVAEASRVLEECKNYKISEINAISENENAATLFSTLFYNIRILAVTNQILTTLLLILKH